MQAYGLWPFSGEIDIMEGSGQQTETVCGIHFGGPWERRANLATRTNCPVKVCMSTAIALGIVTCLNSVFCLQSTKAVLPGMQAVQHGVLKRALQEDLHVAYSMQGGQSRPCGNGRLHTWILDWQVEYVAGAPMATLTWWLDGMQIKQVTSKQWWTNVPVRSACLTPAAHLKRRPALRLQ